MTQRWMNLICRTAPALLSAFTIPLNASATILFAGGEDVDFSPVGGATVTTTSGLYRSSYARGALAVTNTPANALNAQFWVPNYSGNLTSGWLSARVATTSILNPGFYNSGDHLFRITDSNGRPRLVMYSANNSQTPTSQFRISKYDITGFGTDLTTCGTSLAASGVVQKIDIYFNYAAAGRFSVYIDGTLACDYQGDITTNGTTSLASFALGTYSHDGAANAPQATYWSEVIFSTTDTRSMSLATLAPSGNGNTQQWTCGGTPAASVNTFANSDTNNCTSSASAQLEEFTVSGLPSGTFSVAALVTSARLSAGSSGPQNFQFDVRTNGTSYKSSNVSPSPTTSLQNYQYVWTLNPNTSAAWTTSDLGAAGFNIGVFSQP